MNPSTFQVAVGDTALGKQLGNTMSVNVLERILVRALPAARLVREGQLTDRWESGIAVRQLEATRGCELEHSFSKVRTTERTRKGASAAEKKSRAKFARNLRL